MKRAGRGANIGFVLLAHDNLERLALLLRYLLEMKAPVALHLDARVAGDAREEFLRQFEGDRHLYLIEPRECHWGHWSIVEATLEGVRLLLAKESGLDYVYNISGSCLPVQPIGALRKFLGAKPAPVDFIESYVIGEERWVFDGLERERIEMVHPFNYQTQRRLFNLSVRIQRRLRRKRKIPEGLTPSFGSQWWCLSVPSLRRILEDEKFGEYCAFFAKSWIPDESFFQTLIRKHSPQISTHSLTYVKFDHFGKPFIFYDDHLSQLEGIDRFFARKTWPGANRLYSHFLDPKRKARPSDSEARARLSSYHESARKAASERRLGLVTQYCFPRGRRAFVTRNRFHVLMGLGYWRRRIYEHYHLSARIAQMGFLFHPGKAETLIGPNFRPAVIEGQHFLRDYRRHQFLQNQIWYNHPKEVSFLAKPSQLCVIRYALAHDPNAQIYLIKGAWLLDLLPRAINNVDRLRRICQIHMRNEAQFIDAFSQSFSRASLHIISLGEFLCDPDAFLTLLPEAFSLDELGVDFAAVTALAEKLAANGVRLDSYDLDQIAHAKRRERDNIVSLSQARG